MKEKKEREYNTRCANILDAWLRTEVISLGGQGKLEHIVKIHGVYNTDYWIQIAFA